MSTQHARFNGDAVMAALAFQEQKSELVAQLGQAAGDRMDTALAQVETLVGKGWPRLEALAEVIVLYRAADAAGRRVRL